MTTLREAAQQALDFIRWSQFVPCQSEPFPQPPSTAPQVEAALKAALAEPVEPVAWRFEARHIDSAWAAAVTLKHPGPEGVYMRNVTPLYTAPPQRKPEPNSDYERGFVDGMSEQARRSVDKAVNAMIKCKPLAEEEIARLVTNDMVKFARAIERAYGIG